MTTHSPWRTYARAVAYEVSALPPDHDARHAYVLRVESRPHGPQSPSAWVVTHMGDVVATAPDSEGALAKARSRSLTLKNPFDGRTAAWILAQEATT